MRCSSSWARFCSWVWSRFRQYATSSCCCSSSCALHCRIWSSYVFLNRASDALFGWRASSRWYSWSSKVTFSCSSPCMIWISCCSCSSSCWWKTWCTLRALVCSCCRSRRNCSSNARVSGVCLMPFAPNNRSRVLQSESGSRVCVCSPKVIVEQTDAASAGILPGDRDEPILDVSEVSSSSEPDDAIELGSVPAPGLQGWWKCAGMRVWSTEPVSRG
mmetsp:Transcript_63669/g.113672  ORF Transcript_63669/g.113672 Transcript_63669/m.113672 type:complete len:217 (-) Transcript_63669:471-1121(-)